MEGEDKRDGEPRSAHRIICLRFVHVSFCQSRFMFLSIQKGVAPLSVLHWSLLAPDSTRNRTTSRCPLQAAMERGVAPSSVVAWSLLAPDSTKNRTTSRCPSSAAMKRGVAPSSVAAWSWLAPDSIKIGRLQGAPPELPSKEALLHHLS